MANYRIKLSDGTITIDLFGGTDSKLREGGLEMPPPQVRDSYVSNPFYDGARLSASKYENRIITINTKIYGSSLADLKTNIRTIQRLLNDAEERTLSGYGAQVYLEYQWGDTADQSTYFDILRGDLSMPRDYVSTLLNQYYILSAVITLVCKPFGRYTNQDIAQATLNNTQSAYTIKDSYLTGSSTKEIYGAKWKFQTLTTTSAYSAVEAAIKCFSFGDLTGITATLALYATSEGLPTGAAIAIKSGIPITQLITWAANAGAISFIKGIFDTPVALSNATVYALVCYLSGGDVTHYISWIYDATAGYANGQGGYSDDSGANWVVYNGENPVDFIFVIYAAETHTNYQDVTMTEAYGDVPAKLYMKVAQTNATGSEKVWVAKRSGSRQTDDLWIEGEDYSSFTEIDAVTTYKFAHGYADTTTSGEYFAEVFAKRVGSATPANTAVSRLNYTINTLPRGQFRVLVRCKVICSTAADYDHLSFGFGYSYGDTTYTPSENLVEYYQCAADSTWEILDLGILNLPPLAESDIADDSSLELRIFQYATQALEDGRTYNWDIDYIFLLPLDEGAIIVDNIAAADVLGIDGITEPPNVFIISAANAIENYPDYVGAPFKLGRESTRIYVLRDDVKTVTFTVDTKYQPQFLVI